jgi:charged multivesicular body protein 4
VEETMEQVREQMEVAEEIGTAISTPIGMDTLDEAELEEELNQLVEEDLQDAFETINVPREKLVPTGSYF